MTLSVSVYSKSERKGEEQTDHINGKLQGGVPGKAWLYKKYYGTALFISNMKESCVRPETVKIPRVFGLKNHIELWNWQLDNELAYSHHACICCKSILTDGMVDPFGVYGPGNIHKHTIWYKKGVRKCF